MCCYRVLGQFSSAFAYCGLLIIQKKIFFTYFCFQGGLGGIGMGLGPGGQPISATQLSMGGGMGSMGPGGKSAFFILKFYRALSLKLSFLCLE